MRYRHEGTSIYTGRSRMTSSGAGAWAVTQPRQIVAGLFSMALLHGQFQERSLGFVGQILQFSWEKDSNWATGRKQAKPDYVGSDPHRRSPARPRGEAFSLAIAPRVLMARPAMAAATARPLALPQPLHFSSASLRHRGKLPYLNDLPRCPIDADSYSVPGT